MKKCLINLNDEMLEKIELIKPFAKTKARTKVLKFCLNETFEIYKKIKV